MTSTEILSRLLKVSNGLLDEGADQFTILMMMDVMKFSILKQIENNIVKQGQSNEEK